MDALGVRGQFALRLARGLLGGCAGARWVRGWGAGRVHASCARWTRGLCPVQLVRASCGGCVGHAAGAGGARCLF